MFHKKSSSVQLFNVSLLNTISVLVRIMGGLITSKIVARFLGPSGMAVVGNLRNFLTSIESFAGLGFQNGIVKYTTEQHNNIEQLYRTLATAFTSILVAVLLISLMLLVGAGYWSDWVFGQYGDYNWVFVVLAFSLPWYIGNLIFMAIINGLGKYREVILLNIWGNVLGVAVSAVLVWKLQLTGALLSLVAFPALLFLFSYYQVHRHFRGMPFLKLNNFDVDTLRGLLSYSAMSLVTAILGPFVYMSIRNSLTAHFGADEAGYWEAMNRLSVFYLMFVSTLLTVYFLPKLSQAKTRGEANAVFKSYYIGIIPVFAAGLVVIYLLRELIVRLLFTEEFLPMVNLFGWQLAGDLLKACSLILGYQLVAKRMTRTFIATEIVSFATLYATSHLLVPLYGSEGAVISYVVVYGIHLLMLILVSQRLYIP